MFFSFPDDARWESERCCVAFGIAIGEYEGVVRVYRRAFQSPSQRKPHARTLPRNVLPSSHSARTDRRAKGPPPALVRRWQHRNHGPRPPRTGAPSAHGPDCLRVGCSMSTALIVHRDAERNLPVRIRIAVPPDGFGSQLDQMIAWLDANCGPGFWAMTPSGTSGVVNDALAISFLNVAHAKAFVNRWCIGCRFEPLPIHG